ncbi:ribosome maturation protein [Sphaerosporella brunnea]|uniref:Ribosome maturation protein n=1 Tax=Sphaerosporella brunnea TaxID=1250544 RepID=A0A5J5F884_9PEZI|nr:ribosome maturation protein [Sphaerosporella brunnea]
MPRGNRELPKVIYKGTEDDWTVMVDSVEDLEKWKTDPTIPLAQVVSSFNVFVTYRQGVTGLLNVAPKFELENEFGTSNTDIVISKILREGKVEKVVNTERQGITNVTEGAMVSH